MSAAASERRSSASRIVRQSASSVRPRAVGGVLAVMRSWRWVAVVPPGETTPSGDAR